MEPNELTILGLCDVLQQILIENDMEDMPIHVGIRPSEGYDVLVEASVRVGRNGVYVG